jgi:hypothetical protein
MAARIATTIRIGTTGEDPPPDEADFCETGLAVVTEACWGCDDWPCVWPFAAWEPFCWLPWPVPPLFAVVVPALEDELSSADSAPPEELEDA